uniref:HSF-type DNA-binding domain-containing protein n=1 Tax=Entomoneis paludosa TaxID=265537 RepID=A0A7S2Y423_9STRA|mmetsp:Transcript_15977/g.33029  ORF Transcript_15977/g.33029 Transcript_15977/m.33029 type:complete len:367 (+) Transcript_15977:97-1197(+)|eukprot:CAMPEP_0172449362 /NCGR_PEP_ID=MMETSP1065-20121228/8095_1 /TAXON_ID=265537 /ORGANISM="Amphiprora paludosa, Strain CCMP125" /LENGTH=366 /DNA_ID=CAMNT_0013201027 /DNA_START=90 /DNA_END=1190 /DNA_ORIENTATION=+
MLSQSLPAPPNQKKQRLSAGKKTDISGVPIFLRKTYQMVNTTNHSIIEWSDDGSTFTIKDPEVFAAETIPEFFKHNNFSSFVRQLNFYGFRKIKADPLRIRDAKTSDHSKLWKFRHAKFQQGRDDLLVEIRKSSQTEAAEKHEVESLRSEISSLKGDLHDMQAEMDQMKEMMKRNQAESERRMMEMMASLSNPKPEPQVSASTVSIGKKRRFTNCASQDEPNVEPTPFTSENLTSFDFGTNGADVLPSYLEDDLFAMLGGNEQVIDDARSEVVSMASTTSSVASQKVQSALSSLPSGLQSVFADRLVALVANPDALQSQADALASLAANASAEVSVQQMGSPTGGDPLVAAAVLEAFLARRHQQGV